MVHQLTLNIEQYLSTFLAMARCGAEPIILL